MEKKRIAVSGEEIIAPKKEYPLRFWYMCPKGVCTIIDVDEYSRKVRLHIMRKIYCIVRLVVWKNQLMNSMKNFWNLVVFLEPEIK